MPPAVPCQPVVRVLITVNTDVLSLTINTRGGDIEQAKLLAYPDTLGSSTRSNCWKPPVVRLGAKRPDW